MHKWYGELAYILIQNSVLVLNLVPRLLSVPFFALLWRNVFTLKNKVWLYFLRSNETPLCNRPNRESRKTPHFNDGLLEFVLLSSSNDPKYFGTQNESRIHRTSLCFILSFQSNISTENRKTHISVNITGTQVDVSKL